MLDIYRELFENLEKADLKYSVFKSLEHLQDDLAGKRGDIDIWFDPRDRNVAVSTALKSGFFKVSWASTKGVAFILIGWDIPTGKQALLHVHMSPIAVKKRSFLPFYFTYNSPPLPATSEIPYQPSKEWGERFEAQRKALKKQGDLALLSKILFNRSKISKLNFTFSLKETLKIYTTYFNRFFWLRGKYRIVRGGLLVALVGVDGSGKSTAVQELEGSAFLRKTGGTKLAYFGNKNFWIPGLMKGRAKEKKLTPWKKFLMGLAMIDIKLRIIPVLLAKWRGRIVICDRYFYDQMLSDPTEKYIKNKFLRRVLNPIIQWMPVRPDVTIYMKISAKEAYKRKQDYDFEKVEATCKAYDELLKDREEVVAIDASQPIEKVHRDIRQSLNKRYKEMAA